jgi:MSHA pilin protein MshD
MQKRQNTTQLDRPLRTLSNQRGLTLMEMVVVILVLGIAMPPLITMMGRVMEENLDVRSIQTASVFGRDLLEEVISKSYDERNNSPWSNPLGPDGSETRATYDDVDDYDGFVENPIAGTTNFSSRVTVYYVDPDGVDLDTVQPDSSNTLDYKRIDVTITNAYVGDQQFSTVVSRARSL